MPDVVIENPVLNSPYEEPRRFRFSDDGITDEVIEARRVSSYFMPIPGAKKRGRQLALETEWTQDRIQENQFINQVRFTDWASIRSWSAVLPLTHTCPRRPSATATSPCSLPA